MSAQNPLMFIDDDRHVAAQVKASIQNWIESARPDISTNDLATIYRTSVAAYRAGNLRARVLSRVRFKVKTPDGNYLPPSDPLMVRLNTGSRNRMERSELTHFAWGRNLIYKERSVVSNAIIDLVWMNPYIWAADVDYWNGLRGFDVFRITRRGPESVRYIEPEDAVYSHYVDFRDDFDGVAPLEVAFMHATMDSGLAELGVSLLRNMAVPMGMVVPDYEAAQKAGGITPAQPSPTDVNKVTDFFRRTVQGVRNFGRVIVTPHSWKFVQVQLDLDKIAMKDTGEMTERRVYAAADIPYGLVSPEESNYAQAYVTRMSWFDFSIKPMAEWYGEIYTEQLAKEYDANYICEPDYSHLDFLKEDTQVKTTYITGRVAAGIMDLFTAQKELEQQPDDRLKDFYMIGGVPVHIDDIPTYWREKGAGGGTASPQPLGFNDVGAPTPTEPTSGALPPQPDGAAPVASFRASTGTPGGTVLFDFAHTAGVQTVQDFLRLKVGGESVVRWTSPEHYHLTLAHASIVDEAQFFRAYEAVKGDLRAMTVEAGPVDVFEQDDQNVLILRVQATDELKAFQRAVYDALVAEGVAVSEYSAPDDWQPHITLAYMAKGVPIPTFDETITVPLTALVFSRDAYAIEYFAIAPDQSPAARSLHAWIPDPIMRDFQRWREISSRKGADYDFISEVIPADTAAYLRLSLHDAPTDEHQADAFIRARRHYIRHHGKGIKVYGETATRYRSVLYNLINSAMESRIDRKAFGDLGRVEITTAFRAAFMDGLRAGGVNTERPDEDEERDLRLEIKAERGYWTALANEVYRKVLPLRDDARALSEQARDTKDPSEKERLQKEALAKYGEFLLKREAVVDRIDLWVNKGLARIHELGKLAAKANQMLRWDLGRTEEHCRTCLAANGQVHRAKDWRRRGIIPKTDKLECGGWQCDCGFTPTDEPARGRLDRIPVSLIGKHHDHDDDDAPEPVDAEQADAEAEDTSIMTHLDELIEAVEQFHAGQPEMGAQPETEGEPVDAEQADAEIDAPEPEAELVHSG